jgi:hypothetical protein
MIINPYNFAAPAAVTLLNEQFEAPGATGWISQTDASYAAWNDVYTPAIVGSYSGRLASTNILRVNAYKSFVATGSCYMRFRFNWTGQATVGSSVLCSFRDSSGNILASLGLLNGSNTFRVSIGLGGSTNAALAPPTNTNLYGWLEFVKGAGTAIARAGWTFDPNRPAWPASGPLVSLVVQNAGTANADAARIMFGRVETTINYRVNIDDIQIQNTPFA